MSPPGSYGRKLFATPAGRRLLAPRSLAVIEREYLRFGTVGIFLSRFLPGFRAVVPPFAGLIGLGAWRTFIPMAIASGIWYGGITVLGSLIGSNWERILAIVAGVNRTLGIVTAPRRRRRSLLGLAEPAPAREGARLARHAGRARPRGPVVPRGHRDRRRLRQGDRGDAGARDRVCRPGSHPRPTATWSRATCATAGGSPPEERRRNRRRRRKCRPASPSTRPDCGKRFGRAQRLELVERMWGVAFSDAGALSPHEDRLMFLAGELLGVRPGEVAELRRRLRAQQQG